MGHLCILLQHAELAAARHVSVKGPMLGLTANMSPFLLQVTPMDVAKCSMQVRLRLCVMACRLCCVCGGLRTARPES